MSAITDFFVVIASFAISSLNSLSLVARPPVALIRIFVFGVWFRPSSPARFSFHRKLFSSVTLDGIIGG